MEELTQQTESGQGKKKFRVLFSSTYFLRRPSNPFLTKQEVPWQFFWWVLKSLLSKVLGWLDLEILCRSWTTPGGFALGSRLGRTEWNSDTTATASVNWTSLFWLVLFRSTLLNHKMFPSDFKLHDLELHPDEKCAWLTVSRYVIQLRKSLSTKTPSLKVLSARPDWLSPSMCADQCSNRLHCGYSKTSYTQRLRGGPVWALFPTSWHSVGSLKSSQRVKEFERPDQLIIAHKSRVSTV